MSAVVITRAYIQHLEQQLALQSLYEEWRTEYIRAHPQPPLENVRFEFDADWRSGQMSIQAAYDLRGIWKVAPVLQTLSGLAPILYWLSLH